MMATATHSRRGSLLPRLRAPSNGSDQEELLPRQSSYTYAISSRQSSCSSIPPRPVPPTPRRMMSPPSATQSKHRRRQSGIPRPASGSSRRVISSQLTVAPSDSTPHKRVSTVGKTAEPPSSWRTPRVSDQPASLVPYAQRKQHLSGLKQQLQVRHYSTQSLSSPGNIGSPRQLSGTSVPSKSPTTVSFASPSGRDVTPRRRLMKPLSPPLPKNQSVTSISCFSSPLATPSPPKSDPASRSKCVTVGVSQVDVVGALLESRMTEEEIEILNEVQKEAATNQHRLRNSLSARQHKQKSPVTSTTPAAAFTRKSDAAAVTLSFNDIANINRLEEQRSSVSSNRPLFINSTIANTCSSSSDLPTTNTISTTVSSGPDDDWEVNLKLVHFAEPPEYWTGRYMTIFSRLTQEEVNEATPASPSCAGSSDRVFETSDVRRMNTALKELRSCCRTTQALQSLETFETKLKENLGLSSSVETSTVDGAADLHSEDGMSMIRTQKRRQQALSSSQHMPTTKDVPTPLSPTKVEPPLLNIWSRLALPKSKTTSNLLNFQSSSPSRLPTPVSHQPRPGDWLSPQHARRISRSRPTLERRSEVLKDVRQFVKTPARIVQRRMTSVPGTPSHGSSVSNEPQNKTLVSSKTMPHLRKASTTTPITKLPQVASLSEFDKVSEDLTCAAFETGRPPPPRPRVRTPATTTKMTKDEEILRTRRRSQRKSSGEMIKGVFDAGMKQVKQMGKRVGGSMSWVGSQEDLSINTLATGTR